MLDEYSQKYYDEKVGEAVNDIATGKHRQPADDDLLGQLIADLSPAQRAALENGLMENKHAARQAELRAAYDTDFQKVVAQYRGTGHQGSQQVQALKARYRNAGLEGI